MQGRKIFIGLVAALSLLCAQTLSAKPKGAKKAARQVTFKVRIENISSPEGQAAADGTRWPFALSPGLYVVSEKGAVLFKEGRRAGAGLEAQAEDGNPEALVKSFRNLERILVITPAELEVSALVWARALLVSEAAREEVERRASA